MTRRANSHVANGTDLQAVESVWRFSFASGVKARMRSAAGIRAASLDSVGVE